MTPFTISSVLALLLAGFVLTLKQRRAAHALFATALVTLAALNGLTAMSGTGPPQIVNAVKMLLAAALPVLLYLHVLSLIAGQRRLRVKEGAHLLMPFVILLLSAGPFAPLQPVRDWLLFGLWSLYAVLSARVLVRLRDAPEVDVVPAGRLWGWLLCVWMACVAVTDLGLALLLDRPSAPELRLLFLAAGFVLLASVAAVQFAVLHRSALVRWLTDRPPVRVARPPNLIVRLEKEMRRSRAFLDPNLTLARFSRQAGQPQRAVADEINAARGRNFRTWLNGFRIEEAKRLLQDDKERSVTEIFLEAGFQTKSTFNAAFKAETGMSPSAWRTSR